MAFEAAHTGSFLHQVTGFIIEAALSLEKSQPWAAGLCSFCEDVQLTYSSCGPHMDVDSVQHGVLVGSSAEQ